MSNIKLAVLASAAFVAFSLGTAAYADTAADHQKKAQQGVDAIRQADPPKVQPPSKTPQQISDEQSKIPQAQIPANFKQKPAEPPAPGK